MCSQLLLPEKGKKEKTFLGFKETHNNFRKTREHDGCAHFPEDSAKARGPAFGTCGWGRWKWVGRGAGGLVRVWHGSFPGNAELPERSQPLFPFIPRNNGS